MIKKLLSSTYMVIILLFMYIPIIALIILSFNSSKYMSTWTGFSFIWYQRLFESELIMDALKNTLIIATLSSIIATVLGTVACIGINNMKKWPKTITMGITNIPMLNAEIVTAISLMLIFIAFGMNSVLQLYL